MKCFLVGGAVRDKLLDYPHHERDWVVVGSTPEEMESRGYKRVGRDFPVFLHPRTNEEYALARTERKTGPGYHGFECNASPDVTLEQDLLRRDLTINAMAEDENGVLIDPYGGLDDLRDGVLRHISPAFAEDPLRVLRVARFAARYALLGFSVAPETLALMRDISAGGELQTLAPERIWTEMEKALGESSPQAFFRIMLDCEALPALFPAWSQSIDTELLHALKRAAEQQIANEGRFAVMCSRLGPDDCRSLCRELRVPNSYSALAMLVCTHSPLAAADELTADYTLQLLEALDCLRRPQHLQQFLDVEQALFPHLDAAPWIRRAADALRRVRPDELIVKGYQGAELGRALRRERLKAIEEELCPNHPSP